MVGARGPILQHREGSRARKQAKFGNDIFSRKAWAGVNMFR